MLVFVTGAAGFIGRAVVKDLLDNGHQVLGLARSDASADKITKAGAQVHRGDLEDIESLKAGARAADGVIHVAYIHDFTPEGFLKGVQVDSAAIEAMGEAMKGTQKPLAVAAGALSVSGMGERATEDTQTPESGGMFIHRGGSERLVQKLSREDGIRGTVIRLAPTVHGAEDWGFIPGLARLAKKNGFVTSVGDGSARWPAVHRFDAATLFRLAIEKGKPGAIYHASAEEIPTGKLMEAIGKKTSLPVEKKSKEEAEPLIGFFANGISADCPFSAEKTKKELNWNPTHPDVLTDIETNYEF